MCFNCLLDPQLRDINDQCLLYLVIMLLLTVVVWCGMCVCVDVQVVCVCFPSLDFAFVRLSINYVFMGVFSFLC